MDDVYKQEYHIRHLGTRSVIVYPSRAQIVRDIRAELRPGANQITIIGLSPTVDEHSIKVEGTGSAIITDIAVESRPNREIFQDIYPDTDDSDSDSDSEKDDDDENSDGEDVAIKEIREKIVALFDEQKRAKEIVASAQNRLKILDSYGTMLTSLPPGKDSVVEVKDFDIAGGLGIYRAEREKIYQDTLDGSVKERGINEQIEKLKKEENRLRKAVQKKKKKSDKKKAKARRAKEKEEQKAARKKDKLAKEKARIRRERESFWPKNVYIVKVSLEAGALTPGSSRRGSVSSDLVTLVSEKPEPKVEDDETTTCDLTLTYVTNYAYWSPSYDLALSTTASSGVLCFDAVLTNMTSETWSNCKVVLSTSQADFSGLNDKIPTLVPWRVRLASKGAFAPGVNQFNQIMYSREEQSQKAGWTSFQNARHAHKPRAQLFGTDNASPFGGFGNRPMALQAAQAFGNQMNTTQKPSGGALFGSNTVGFGSVGNQNYQQNSNSGGLFGGGFGNTNNPGGSLFGQAAPSNNAPTTMAAPQSSNPFGAPRQAVLSDREKEDHLQVDERIKSDLSPEELRYASGDTSAPVVEEHNELDFQESSFEETGFTTTYELPGLKSLVPSSTTSKQRVARIQFTSVAFSHTVVAKYKPAAYLKARLRNGSKLTLLRGPTGLTLDGSFMGRTSLPRCSPGDSFNLSLGVDPAIRVAYPKPDVKRSQSGLFTKEDSSAYTRTITLSNTRSGEKGKPMQITVLDQVPVSEDEKLKIDIVQPRGLVFGGTGIATGTPGREGKEFADWGKAVATLKKGGEISWDVKLHAGRMVKLGLEYELSYPAGEHAVNV